MNLCSDGHDEVCYEGRDCPMCLLNGLIEELNIEVEDLKTEE